MVRPERRERIRAPLHWHILLFRNQAAEAIESLTRDLSSSGFFCLTKTPLTPGEVLTCTLRVPTHDPNGKHLERSLECRARVVRVQAQPEGTFGVACQIEDYHFARTVGRLPGIPLK